MIHFHKEKKFMKQRWLINTNSLQNVNFKTCAVQSGFHGNQAGEAKQTDITKWSLSWTTNQRGHKLIIGTMEKSRKSDSTMNRMDSNQDNDTGQLGPGASFTVFILMEDLIDKMKLLKYETEFAKEFNIKPLSR